MASNKDWYISKTKAGVILMKVSNSKPITKKGKSIGYVVDVELSKSNASMIKVIY